MSNSGFTRRHIGIAFCVFLTLSKSSFLSAQSIPAIEDIEQSRQVFIAEVVAKHDIPQAELADLLSKANIKPDILAAISKPAERSLDWKRYRSIFIQDSRIQAGKQFKRNNIAALTRAEEKYGVPAEIITAIIGVETKYGQVMGKHRVIDALSTLAFAYPKRARFFRSELENYLLLAREQGIDPLKPVGSYAGAMGYGQFMPSSYRHYAVDFDGDGLVDIWNNKTDAIGSIANYFAKHGWRKGGTARIQLSRNKASLIDKAMNSSLKPKLRATQLPDYGFTQPEQLGNKERVALFRFQAETGAQYWAGLKNFYVVTRYNHSRLYAMAVLDLAEQVAAEKPREL